MCEIGRTVSLKKKIEYRPWVLQIINYEVAWLKILRNRNWQSLMSNWIHRLLFSDQTPGSGMIRIRNLAVSNVCMYNPNSIRTILPVLKCEGPSTLWTVISVNISVYTTRLNTRNTRNLIYELGIRNMGISYRFYNQHCIYSNTFTEYLEQVKISITLH